MGPSKVLEEEYFVERRSILCLVNRPNDTEFQLPIQEHYGQYNGFGIYGRPSYPFDVGNATIFIEFISVLSEYYKSEDYNAVEKRLCHISPAKDELI